MEDAEIDPRVAQQYSRLAGFFFPLAREIHVLPPGEEVGDIPFGLAVAEKYEFWHIPRVVIGGCPRHLREQASSGHLTQ